MITRHGDGETGRLGESPRPRVSASFLGRLSSAVVSRFLSSEIERRVSLAVAALDDRTDRAWKKTEGDRDRYAYNREELLQQCLDAWRENPLARRIVELTSDYVVGGGIGVECEHPETHEFLDKWWNHRLNRMPTRVFEWCDELTRSGEIFIVASTDASGMTYVRAVPALDIADIQSAPNDVEQEIAFVERPYYNPSALDARTWPAYSDAETLGHGEGVPNGTHASPDPRVSVSSLSASPFRPVMLHYAVNRPVGAQRGESDLAPLLKHLRRYDAWLEDRLRLNRYRQSFLYWVHKKFTTAAERLKRQAELNANPPNPGSVLVTDEEEIWEVMHPNLESGDAERDGLALKKTIAAGAGIPLHFLAEPESSTRTTAEQAGGPTFRHYDRRQQFFLWLLMDLAHIVVRRRALVDSHVSIRAKIKTSGTDISVRDNASIALAATRIVEAFAVLRDRGVITDEELLRMTYRFAGEIVDVPTLLEKAKQEDAEKRRHGEGVGVPTGPHASPGPGVGVPTGTQPSQVVQPLPKVEDPGTDDDDSGDSEGDSSNE